VGFWIGTGLNQPAIEVHLSQGLQDDLCSDTRLAKEFEFNARDKVRTDFDIDTGIR
jgi:hypothetical protein